MLKKFGGLWQRLKALAFDYVFIMLYLIVVVGLSMLLNILAPSFFKMIFANQLSSELFGFLIVTIPVSFYFILSEASSRQATWGKQRIKLKVIRFKDGKPISITRSIGRTALKFAPWELSHASIWFITFHPDTSSPIFTIGVTLVFFLVGLNILALLLSPAHRTIYDMIAGTAVEQIE